MLDIVANYYWMQFKEKRIIETQENAEKPHFEYESRIFSFFFENIALSVTRCHGVLSLLQYQKKLIIQS